MRKISDREGSVIVTSEAIFTASQTGSVYNVPSLLNIRNSINQRANSINYLLPGNIPINPNIPVNRRSNVSMFIHVVVIYAIYYIPHILV